MAQVFIYGGCVSRDAVRYYPSYGMSLIGYVARQSLPSAFAPAKLSDYILAPTLSGFQQRMIKGDIQSSLPSILTEQASKIDIIIWDLNIERVGFSALNTGGIVTRNGAQMTSKSVLVEDAYAFGSDSHFRIWDLALEKFVELLRNTGLLCRTFVNATPWATEADVSVSATRWDPHDFNRLIPRYWERAESAGIKLIHVPSKKALADPDHKWGPAYFHYQPQAYKTQVKLIAKSAGLKRVRRLPTRETIRNFLDRHV